MSNYTRHLSAAKGSAKPALEISNQGNKDAVAALLLNSKGDFATYFGLDTDNALTIGGFSLDGKRYRIFMKILPVTWRICLKSQVSVRMKIPNLSSNADKRSPEALMRMPIFGKVLTSLFMKVYGQYR